MIRTAHADRDRVPPRRHRRWVLVGVDRGRRRRRRRRSLRDGRRRVRRRLPHRDGGDAVRRPDARHGRNHRTREPGGGRVPRERHGRVDRDRGRRHRSRTGQLLATLDTTALQATVDERQAALDQAELTLERARNGESVGSVGKRLQTGNGSGARIEAAAFTPTASGAPGSTPARTSTADPQLAAAQQAVLDAQKQVDADLLAAEQALAAADQICGASPTEPAPTSATTPTTTRRRPRRPRRQTADSGHDRVPRRVAGGARRAAHRRAEPDRARAGVDRARRAARSSRVHVVRERSGAAVGCAVAITRRRRVRARPAATGRDRRELVAVGRRSDRVPEGGRRGRGAARGRRAGGRAGDDREPDRGHGGRGQLRGR